MQRVLCALAVCAGLVGAKAGVDNKLATSVAQLINKQINKKVEVLETFPLKSNKEFQVVVVQDPDTKYRIPFLVNRSGSLAVGLTNMFFSESKDDVGFVDSIYHDSQVHNFKQQHSVALNKLFQAIPKDYVITLKSSVKGVKKDLYIISDPSCPHCRNELGGVHERLKNANVHMVLVGFLGKESNLKAAHILSKIKNKHSTEAKIDLLNKVYASAYKVSPSDVPDDKLQEVEKVTKQVLDTKLVKGVPFIYEYEGSSTASKK
ncbi:Disulfide isomerase [Helicobacter bizzozeronii]|uniref:DsbA family protein n=1 Tax=Helicobacter bizzozeronii TaxID=56877 RepID=UPI00244D8A36|nr:disulfide isomerase [Helicobacter bizzozeronii]GMB92364.1 Disulfide isomerase [Helicobacter bizzozeronii]